MVQRQTITRWLSQLTNHASQSKWGELRESVAAPTIRPFTGHRMFRFLCFFLVPNPLLGHHSGCCSVLGMYNQTYSEQKHIRVRCISITLFTCHRSYSLCQKIVWPRVVSIRSTRERNEVCLTPKPMKNLTCQTQTTLPLAGKVLYRDYIHIWV